MSTANNDVMVIENGNVVDSAPQPASGNKIVVANPLGLGDKYEITEAAKRYQAMIPAFAELSLVDCMLVAQVSFKMRLNPFIGEIYAFYNFQSVKDNSGQWTKVKKLILTLGYKALVRWAKRQSDYDADYRELSKDEKANEGLPEDSIAFHCKITRHDTLSRVQFLVNGGLPIREALEMVSTVGLGVVLNSDTVTKDGKPIPCPKGWSWKQSARKRALKNALMLAYSLPSIDELGEGAFDYDGYDEEDPFAQQRAAVNSANALPSEQRKEAMNERVNMMRGNKDEEYID